MVVQQSEVNLWQLHYFLFLLLNNSCRLLLTSGAALRFEPSLSSMLFSFLFYDFFFIIVSIHSRNKKFMTFQSFVRRDE